MCHARWLVLLIVLAGCHSSSQFARIVKPGEKELIGSHQAGQETFRPLVEEAVAKLLARHDPAVIQPVSYPAGQLPPPAGRPTVCFVGVANRSVEEIGDFKDQIFQAIDTKLHESTAFSPLSHQYVDAGLRQLHVRPDELFVPENMRNFCSVMERNGTPIQYLLFATITSGTTRENSEFQRNYQLVVELVDVHSGVADKQSAELTKAYHKSRLSRWSSGRLFR